jgi:hypothetical protein
MAIMRQFKPGQLQTGSLYPITASNAVTASYAVLALSASYAISASYEINYETSSSYAETASFAQSSSYALTASYISGSISIDTGSLVTTASFNAFTASYTTGSFTGSFKGDGSQLTGIVSSKWTGSNPISRESDVEISGSLRVQGSITGSLFGTASNATTASYFAETDPIFVAKSGSFATTGSNIFKGNQTITGSNGKLIYTGTTSGVYPINTLAEIHTNDDNPWLEKFYNDTFSTSSAVMAYFGWNDGRFVFHNESTQSIGLQVNGFGAENGLLVYSDKVAFVNNVEVTGSLNVVGGITGSLFGTASWATNAITASYITASGVYGPYGSNSITSASYAQTASYSRNLQISGSVNNVDYIDFNTGSAIPAWKSGRVFWDNTDGALSVYNAEADITLQVGQENWTRVSNRTGTTITNGTVVRLIGAHGDVPEVERAQSILVSGSVNLQNQILGVATHDIEDNSKGYVTTQGLVRGLNTNAFNDGDTLFVGTGSAGVLQNIAPIAPYEIIPVGVCVKAGPGGSGMIYVAVQEPIDFSDLSSALVDGIYHYGDLWTYVQTGSVGVWKHTNQLSGSYGLTGSLTATQITASNLYAGATYISGSLTVFGPSTFYGTASFVNVTASNLFISESFISVNVFEPIERFGGLKVYDSGSSTATASLAWDSLHNHWVYQNVDGLTYTGGMLLSGPRNTGSLGDEPNLTKWFVPRSDGGDHLDNSQIFTSGSITQITGSLTVTSGVTASLLGTASFARNATSASYALTASYLDNYIAPFPFTGSAQITGSLGINGSLSNGVPTNQASGSFSHAEGQNTQANGYASHAEGRGAIANGQASHAEGESTQANGYASHAEGYTTTTLGNYSHAEGNDAKTVGLYSHAEGIFSYTGQNAYSCSINNGNVEIDASQGDLTGTYLDGTIIYYGNINNIGNPISSGIVTGSFFNGTNTTFQLLNDASITIAAAGIIDGGGNLTNQLGGYGAHAEGYGSRAIGDYAHAEGRSAMAIGTYSHAEGDSTIAYGNSSHAEGAAVTFADHSHAEGTGNTFADYSHAEGSGTAGYKAYTTVNIAAGVITFPAYYGDLTAIFAPTTIIYVEDQNQSTILIHEVASSLFNGNETEVTLVDSAYDPQSGNLVGIVGNTQPPYADTYIGGASHAEGRATTTLGGYSHASGLSTIAHGFHQNVTGRYNAPVQVSSSFVIGNGLDDATRSNLLVAYGNAVQVSGSLEISGSIIPNVDGVSVTSSFSLGSATNAWKDIWVANSSIYMLDTTGSIQTTIASNESGVSLTGSLHGTASFAATASYALNGGGSGGDTTAIEAQLWFLM